MCNRCQVDSKQSKQFCAEFYKHRNVFISTTNRAKNRMKFNWIYSREQFEKFQKCLYQDLKRIIIFMASWRERLKEEKSKCFFGPRHEITGNERFCNGIFCGFIIYTNTLSGKKNSRRIDLQQWQWCENKECGMRCHWVRVCLCGLILNSFHCETIFVTCLQKAFVYLFTTLLACHLNRNCIHYCVACH